MIKVNIWCKEVWSKKYHVASLEEESYFEMRFQEVVVRGKDIVG